jgi:hypothetical protein
MNKRPTKDDLVEMARTNPDGNGIAWVEGDSVHWRKGITLEEMQDFNATLPVPYILHFRIATAGSISKALCHPFPVTPNAQLTLSGTTKTGVLFHNGVWPEWKRQAMQFGMGHKVPTGEWSDSRVMAWIAGHQGHGLCEWMDQKIVVLAPEGAYLYGMTLRDTWEDHLGYMVSNKRWIPKPPAYHMTVPASLLGPAGGPAHHPSFRDDPDDDFVIRAAGNWLRGCASTPGSEPQAIPQDVKSPRKKPSLAEELFHWARSINVR